MHDVAGAFKIGECILLARADSTWEYRTSVCDISTSGNSSQGKKCQRRYCGVGLARLGPLQRPAYYLYQYAPAGGIGMHILHVATTQQLLTSKFNLAAAAHSLELNFLHTSSWTKCRLLCLRPSAPCLSHTFSHSLCSSRPYSLFIVQYLIRSATLGCIELRQPST